MEFTNEIYFDKNLIENNTVKISYTGKLFREFSSEVYIVFGYGPNWNNTQEQKMDLSENCFYTDINITGTDTFNFCFRNNYNIWDNNNTFNYIATIYPEDNNTSEDKTYSESGSIESVDLDDENIESNEDVENVSEETTDNSTNNFKNENNQDLFSELLETLLNDTEISNQENDLPITDESSYGLQNFESVEVDSVDSINKLFNEIYSENNSSSFSETQNISQDDLDALFDKIFNYEESQEVSEEVSSELEDLMNNILNSVLESNSINDNIIEELDSAIDNQVNVYEASVTEEANTPIQEELAVDIISENSQIQDISELSSSELVPAVVSTSKIDMFFDASYKFLQNVGAACKKLGALIKLKAQEYGLIKED